MKSSKTEEIRICQRCGVPDKIGLREGACAAYGDAYNRHLWGKDDTPKAEIEKWEVQWDKMPPQMVGLAVEKTEKAFISKLLQKEYKKGYKKGYDTCLEEFVTGLSQNNEK